MSKQEHHVNKSTLRRLAAQSRRELAEKIRLSQMIQENLLSQASFAKAETILFYCAVRDEVRTNFALTAALNTGKRIGVPWCRENRVLELFHLQEMSELSTGRYGIPEPSAPLRNRPQRTLVPTDLDLVVVPGVAFDPSGRRLGHGQGYYDKLLAGVRPDCRLIGLAFECQIVPEIPTEPHDVPMGMVITESRVIER